ncbi:hypothetical protein AOQ84DRAFT_126153 [Glonium stellatum]|uniref:Uncharacterized protein n=1 Tax=Glonium stellatum TaxID=574774 RepID=A0A8E2JXG8_9PEZI|nr:hypothetical protein AOQ84DRAFT_126153 [Glonium stellatum]
MPARLTALTSLVWLRTKSFLCCLFSCLPNCLAFRRLKKSWLDGFIVSCHFWSLLSPLKGRVEGRHVVSWAEHGALYSLFSTPPHCGTSFTFPFTLIGFFHTGDGYVESIHTCPNVVFFTFA